MNAPPAPTRIVPWGNDPLYRRFALGLCRGNAAVTAFVYFLVSYVGSMLIGLATGHFHGTATLEPMYANLESTVNLGIFVPVGVYLLCHFYTAVHAAFGDLLDNGAVPPAHEAAYRAYLSRFEARLNSFRPVRVCAAFALALDLYVFFFKTASWHCIDGGILGVYASVFKFINFYYIFFTFWKCLLVVRALRRLPDFGLAVRPLHPDEAGGLLPAGRVALAVNWFLALLMGYLTFVAIFDPYFSRNRAYILITIAFYPVAIATLHLSLSGLHRHMVIAREAMLGKLSREIDAFLTDTSGRNLPLPEAHSELYPLVRDMPTWPFRTGSAARFVTTITIPFLALLVQLVASRDSVFWDPRILEAVERLLAPPG